MRYVLDNLSWIISCLIALLAIAVQIYLEYRKRHKDSVEIPTSIIKTISIYQEDIQVMRNQNVLLQKELDGIRQLPPAQPASVSLDMKDRINQLIKESLSRDTKPELLQLIDEILTKPDLNIEAAFRNGYEYEGLFNLLKSYPFKSKALQHLMETHFNEALDETIQFKAALTWNLLMEDESINLFKSGLLNTLKKNASGVQQIEYFWHLVNVGFAYFGPSFSFVERGENFKELFESSHEALLKNAFELVGSDDQRVIQAAAWALVWLTNARSETGAIQRCFTEGESELLYRSFAKAKRIKAIFYLMEVLDFSIIDKYAYRGNFAFSCAEAIDYHQPVPELVYQPANVDLCRLIHSKYIVSSEEIKNDLARYLAKYGYKEFSAAVRLMTSCREDEDITFILFTLVPYVNLVSEKDMISYVTEWLRHDDKIVRFCGLLLQKALEKSSTELLSIMADSKYSIATTNDIPPVNVSELELFKGKKAGAVYNIIRLMYSQCHKITANDTTGRRAWYVVLVPQAIERSFLEKIDNKMGKVDLEDYGIVIISGYGDKVPENVDELIFQKYSIAASL